MHIAYLHLHPQRPGEAPATHVRGIVDGLRALGHRVDECTPGATSDPVGRVREARRVQQAAADVGADVVYVRQHLLATSVVRLAGERAVPVVQEVNGTGLDYTMARPWLRPARPLVDAALGRQLRHSSGVVTVTERLADWARGHGAGQVAVIGNAADRAVAEASVAPQPPAVLQGRRYVLYFGALAAWQGIPTALAATRATAWPQDVALVVLGDGALGPLVEAAAAEDPRGVLRLPPVDGEQVPGIVAGALATVCLPHDDTRAQFGLSPIKVFESLAVGTPVVASRLPGLQELVTDTGGGVLVPADDPRAVASTVADLDADPERRAALGQAGRDAVLARHTWDHRAAATADFLARVVAGR